MLYFFVFGANKDVIKVYYHKNVKLLCWNLVNIALECGQCIDQSKKYYLVFKIAIAGPESGFPFIVFPNPHSIVSIGQIKLGKTLSLT